MLRELDRLAADIDREPASVGRRAAELLRTARSTDDLVVTARAATLVARAKRDLRQMEAAELAIGEAIAVATDVGGDILADAHMVAASIASHRTGPDRVAEHLAVARRHSSEGFRWKVAVQEAILGKRAGDLDGALAGYDAAIADLTHRDEPVVLARLLSNRGNIHGLRGRVRSAVDDYRRSIELFEACDQEFAVAVVTQNLAESTARLGDAAGALQLLDDAAARLSELGQTMFDAQSIKAETLIAIGLFSDAIDLLEPAVRTLLADGDRTGAAEAALVQAEAMRLAGRPSRSVAAQACRVFEEHGLGGLAAQAELECLRAEETVGDPSLTMAAACRATRLSDQLERSGAIRAAIDASSLAATLALAGGDRRSAVAQAARCERLAASMPFVEHRLAAEHARAAVSIAQTDGDSMTDRRNVDAIEHVLGEFDRYRATIGSPDGRRGSAVHAAGLERLGARLVGRSRDPLDLLIWSEQRRASRQLLACGEASPTTEAATSGAVLELRAVLDELHRHEQGAAEEATPSRLLDRRVELERKVREAEAGRRRHPAAPERVPLGPVGVETVRDVLATAELNEHVFVSIDAHGDELVAVVLHRSELRRVRLGTPHAGRRLSTGIRGVLDRAAGTRGDADRYRGAVDALDRFLAPLDLPVGEVVIAMPLELQAAPWCATPTLRGRVVTLTPSLFAWASRHPRHPLPCAPSIAVLSGPRLEHTPREVAAVASCYEHAITTDDLGEALRRADIVHVAAHTRLRDENPMWSTIDLGGGPVEAHRFLGADMRPSLVVLSTCDSAVPIGRPGTAFAGFAALLVGRGVDHTVATAGKLADAPDTVEVMRSFHRRVSGGTDPATALAACRREHPDSVAADSLLCWSR